MQHRRVALVAAGTITAFGVVAFAVFRPDKLVVDERVDDRLSPEIAAAVDDAASSQMSSAPDAVTDPAVTAVPPAAPDAPAAPAATTAPTVRPPVPAAPAPALVGSGEFVAQAGHRISGRAAVLEVDGGRLLVFDELDSENGPDLRVYLSPSSTGSVDGGLQIAPLKGNQGTQTYPLPASIDLALLPHVVIWCERFDVPFGTATVLN